MKINLHTVVFVICDEETEKWRLYWYDLFREFRATYQVPMNFESIFHTTTKKQIMNLEAELGNGPELIVMFVKPDDYHHHLVELTRKYYYSPMALVIEGQVNSDIFDRAIIRPKPQKSDVLEFANFKEWRQTRLPPDIERWVVIGDLHACIDELRELLGKFDIIIDEHDHVHLPPHQGIVFVGDLIDKGTKTEETIVFLHRNLDKFHFVRGNHDEFVWKYLHGRLPYATEDEIAHHDSIPFFQSHDETREKFFQIYDKMAEFLQCRSFIVTHSPCWAHELGKFDQESLRLQRQMKLEKGVPLRDQMQCLDSWVPEHVRHVFGHIPFDFMLHDSSRRRFGVDGGCIHGGCLVGMNFYADSYENPEFSVVKFHGKQGIYPEEMVLGEIK